MQRAIVFTLIGLIYAAFAVAIVASIQDNRRPEPLAADTEPPMLIPDGKTLRIVAWLPIAAFISIPLAIPQILLIQFFEIDSPWLVIPILAAIPLLAVYLAMASAIRCPRCGLRLILKRQQRPRFGEPSKNRNAWGEVLHRIRKGKPFRCMFCGQRYHLGDPAQSS